MRTVNNRSRLCYSRGSAKSMRTCCLSGRVKLTDAQLPLHYRKSVWGNIFGRCTDLAEEAKISPRDFGCISESIDNFIEGSKPPASVLSTHPTVEAFQQPHQLVSEDGVGKPRGWPPHTQPTSRGRGDKVMAHMEDHARNAR